MFKYIEIGEILKPFRTEGELLAVIEDKFISDAEKAKAIFIETNGLKVPFFIENIESDDDLSYIKFEEFSGPEEVKKYNGLKLYLRETDISAPVKESGKNEKADLSKFIIVDINTDNSYRISRTEQYPQQLMAIISKDSEDKLIPLVDEWIVSIDEEKKEILMSLPENLI